MRSSFSFLISVLLLGSVSARAAEPAADFMQQPGPAAEPGKALTADDLAAWVLERNPGLAALEAAADAAVHRIEPAGSLDDPMLSFAAAPRTTGMPQGLNQRIELMQKLPWPGTLAARAEAARHEADAAEHDVDSWRLKLTALARSAHAEWRFVERALEINRASRALLDDLISAAETRYAAGRAPKQDVLQAKVERADLDNQQLGLLQQQQTIRARINALLNRSPQEPLPIAAPFPAPMPPPDIKTLQRLALERHPALGRLGAQIAGNTSQVTLAEKAFYPNLHLGVGYNSLWDEADKRPTIGLSINIPLDRSKRRAELDRARAEVRRAEWSLAEQRAQLLADLATAHARIVEMRDAVRLHEDALVPLAAEYLEAAVADYQSGTGAFLNVITAEQRKLGTDLALARVRADYARRLAELERWAGGPLDVAPQAAAGVQR